MRAPFKKVPLLLLRSCTRQPLVPHSTAKCTPDINVSCGKANCARPAARPNVTVSPVVRPMTFPAIGPSRISRIIPIHLLVQLARLIQFVWPRQHPGGRGEISALPSGLPLFHPLEHPCHK